ncbi:lymphocyte-specific protein 1 isoform X4 [Rhineura floridana]|uniref:lymphocyte-specific protein 1 isoform X4 n=1 Tax=Rhineura floridana TaxID=261503 RepID=UPI002AC85683|nr:lymphocyte-specific protein 1 isoform X4 [Rhineura floridana]
MEPLTGVVLHAKGSFFSHHQSPNEVFTLSLERLTAQWSVEDEEEAARERRRRERERQLRSQAEEGLTTTTTTSSESGVSAQESRPRSPRHPFEEDDGNLRETEAKLEQVHLDQVSPTFIRFVPGPSNFLKFASSSVLQDQPEAEAELEEQQKLRDAVDIGEENQDVGEELQDVEEEFQHVTKENKHEEEKEMQEEKKRRWNEEEEAPEKRQRAPSTSSQEEETQPPLSPATKITDRTESLNRSVQKSNSVKKTQPPLPVSKIGDKLEQYTHAIETSSKTPKPVRQLSIDLPTNSAAVASTKNLWETGEVAQSPVKTTPCKDIVAGDIVNKRSMWEHKESPRTDENAKVKLPGKKYKYVATGHGQYKKVLIEDDGATQK